MTLDGGDTHRRHRRKGAPGPSTRSLLERWQATLRAELEEVLGELRPPPPEPIEFGAPPPKGRPDLATRARLIDLGVRIAHELGTELDTTPRTAAAPDTPHRPRPRSRVEFGGT